MPDEKCLLDLIPSGPVYSDEFDLRGLKAKFRLLDSREMDWCRMAAQKRVLDNLTEALGDRDTALDVIKTAPPGSMAADSLTEWQDVYMLSSSLCDKDGAPISPGEPHAVAFEFADKFTPLDRFNLVAEYLEFVDEHDPTRAIDDEALREMIAALGKSPDDSTLKQYGSSLLRTFVITLAERNADLSMQLAAAQAALEDADDPLTARVEALEQKIYQTPKSSDGSD